MADVVRAHAIRREAAVAWNLFFEKYDFLLTPTVAVQPFAVLNNAPPGVEGKPNMMWSPYTATFNLTRHPAASVPCGLSSGGLPVGLQIVAGHFKDARVLALAAAYAAQHPIAFPALPETKP
jgi:aspartyl-tRNA(Asn)/glutamyl-tRNA(Gln) amidotransferase subunit A